MIRVKDLLMLCVDETDGFSERRTKISAQQHSSRHSVAAPEAGLGAETDTLFLFTNSKIPSSPSSRP